MPVCVCPKVKDMHRSLFGFNLKLKVQMNEMNENMPLKMGVQFAVPVYMGRMFLDIFNEVRGKSAKTELPIM